MNYLSKLQNAKLSIYATYYKIEPTFRLDENLTIENLHTTHKFVRNCPAKSLDDCFFKSQGEYWSPNGEANSLIDSLGLKHTSMSVGDVIQNLKNNRYYEVDNVGFRQLK